MTESDIRKGMPPVKLSREEFERRYGSVGDKRFRDELGRLRKRVRALAGYRE